MKPRTIAGGILLAVTVGAAGGCQPAGPAPLPLPDREGGPRLEQGPATAEQEARAAELYALARRQYTAEQLDSARVLATRVVEELATTAGAPPALLLRARIGLRQGQLDAARADANRYAALYPPDSPEAEAARAVVREVDALVEEARPVVLGVILPETGDAYLQRYGEAIREGIEVAMQTTGAGIGASLMVVDGGGTVMGAAEAMRRLTQAGVTGVVGPLLSDAVLAAADARRASWPVIISPTASEPLQGAPRAYSLNLPDANALGVLGRHAAAQGLFPRGAALYLLDEQFQAEAAAFLSAFEGAGGQVVASVSFHAGTTTFEDPITRVAEADPDVVFVAAPEREVRQLASQLRYYGLHADSVRIYGGETWTTPVSQQALRSAGLPEVISILTQPRSGVSEARERFIEAYEATFRKSLTSPYPALGYDAAMLLLRAAPGARSAEEVAERLESGTRFAGASGMLIVQDGVITRVPEVVRITAQGIEPIDDFAN
ncbi:MAG: ABC transporter substrate-binding protein [Longimicrobiales bacterium]